MNEPRVPHNGDTLVQHLGPTLRAFGLAALASFALGGCLYSSSYASEGAYSGSSYEDTPTVRGRGQLLQGDLGEYQGMQTAAPELVLRQRSATYATVRLDHDDVRANAWMMTELTIEGGLSHPALRPGAHLTFDANHRSAEAPGLDVSVLGCSGPERDRFTYDRRADTTDVDVFAGDDGKYLLVFTGRFTHDGAQQVVRGAFQFAPQ